MPLWNLIKKIRTDAQLSQARFAEELGVNSSYISQIEQTDSKKAVSEEVCRKIAQTFGQTAEEKTSIEEKLLEARGQMLIGKTVQKVQGSTGHAPVMVDTASCVSFSGGTSHVFIKRLKEDIKDKIHLFKESEKEILNCVIDKKQTTLISRLFVVDLARKLGQPIEEYLLLANQLPENLSHIMQNERMVALFRDLGKLDSSDLTDVIDILDRVVAPYIKKSKKSY
jgi:transcriptional regulator with XRE-family HTH domain